ncbi:hypothetical protein RBH20_20915 [Haloarcula sp. H-GB4]|uniref:hypothetical protein n=1 Tax=Haloarcula sp. H-GB4 TaxID=3069755 RepID=UPI0027B12ECA|nr:hypothetical protein [Haloarcula sp. H-GB4]MDQ2074985.1 hypothetical protein [Haloarcula sp. H-GB4]
MRQEGVVEWAQTLLTIGFIRYLRRGDYIEKSDISLGDRNVEVYKFCQGNGPPAQKTLWDTIIWDKSSLESITVEEQELVLEHELSHRDRNPVYKGIFIGALLMLAPGLFILLYSPLHLLNGAPLTELVDSVVAGFSIVAGFVLIWRIEEMWADYDAICALGEDKFMTAYRRFKTGSDASMAHKILEKVVYTKPENTRRLYRRLHQSD